MRVRGGDHGEAVLHIYSEVSSEPTMHCVNTQPTRAQVKDADTAIHRAGEEAGCKCVPGKATAVFLPLTQQ